MPNDQHVRIVVRLAGEDSEIEQLFELERELETLVQQSGLGELDGNEFGGDSFSWYLYGPDAGKLLELIMPFVLQSALPAGSHVLVRRGPPGVPEEAIPLRETVT